MKIKILLISLALTLAAFSTNAFAAEASGSLSAEANLSDFQFSNGVADAYATVNAGNDYGLVTGHTSSYDVFAATSFKSGIYKLTGTAGTKVTSSTCVNALGTPASNSYTGEGWSQL